MSKLNLTPENTSYSVAQRSETVSAQLSGGAARYRRDIIGSVFDVSLSFKLNAEEYEYLMAFYRTSAYHGANEFQMDLILDTGTLTEYNVHFAEGNPPRLTGQQGLAYFVSIELEVVNPINPDEATDDQAVIDTFNTAHGFS